MLDLRGLDPLGVGDGPAAAVREWQMLGLAEQLAAFDPVVVSSFAAGLHGSQSDLDVVCDIRAGGFVEAVTAAYGQRPAFMHWISGPRTVITFKGEWLPVELVAEALPVERQAAYRHAVAHRRLVECGGARFATAVRGVRLHQRMKTEPAIAAVLGLAGDPYAAVDRLAEAPSVELRDLMAAAENGPYWLRTA